MEELKNKKRPTKTEQLPNRKTPTTNEQLINKKVPIKNEQLINKKITKNKKKLKMKKRIKFPKHFGRVKTDFQNLILSIINKKIKGIEIKFEKNSVTDFICSIDGPHDTPYEGGKFFLKMTVKDNHPYEAPTIKFVTPIYHCNVNINNGKICLDILKDQWSPVLTFEKILVSIQSLMDDQNADDPLNAQAAKQYLENKKCFILKAKNHTRRHAMDHLQKQYL